MIYLGLAGTGGSSTLQSAVVYAEQHGVDVVASAGNYGTSTPYYPAAYQGVISVAGSTSSGPLYS